MRASFIYLGHKWTFRFLFDNMLLHLLWHSSYSLKKCDTHVFFIFSWWRVSLVLLSVVKKLVWWLLICFGDHDHFGIFVNLRMESCFLKNLLLFSFFSIFLNFITIVQKSINNVDLLIFFLGNNSNRLIQDLWSRVMMNRLLLFHHFLRRFIGREPIFYLLASFASHHSHAVFIKFWLEKFFLSFLVFFLLSNLLSSLFVNIIATKKSIFNRFNIWVKRSSWLVKLLLSLSRTCSLIPKSVSD